MSQQDILDAGTARIKVNDGDGDGGGGGGGPDGALLIYRDGIDG
ncbi:hypothetical protein [Arthrobacter sp. CG_A4]|nr:hypothetical protein [Arthrobacter sp. CG_A4]